MTPGKYTTKGWPKDLHFPRSLFLTDPDEPVWITRRWVGIVGPSRRQVNAAFAETTTDNFVTISRATHLLDSDF